MQFIKNKQDIINWLDSNNIKNYVLIENNEYGFVINTNESVDLKNKKISVIPVKFNMIRGSFDCSGNELISLDFAPKVVIDNFNCDNNNLTSLKGCPGYIGKNLTCTNNKLISLEGCPKNINGSLDCGANALTTLEFCSQTVAYDFHCDHNLLHNLQYAPDIKYGLMDCSENKINTLEFLPVISSKILIIAMNPSLEQFQSSNYTEIRQEHMRIHKILKEKENLDSKLSRVSDKKSIKKKI